MSYFVHHSTGWLEYDPRPEGLTPKKFEPWWAILVCDPGIIEFYAWLSRRHGRPITINQLWGPHVSFVKGERPPNLDLWGKDRGLINFHYTNTIRYDNGCHAWLDVECERLHEIRAELGLPIYPHDKKDRRMSLHLTLGRFV